MNPPTQEAEAALASTTASSQVVKEDLAAAIESAQSSGWGQKGGASLVAEAKAQLAAITELLEKVGDDGTTTTTTKVVVNNA